MTNIDIPPGARAMLIRRGNMEAVLPIAGDVFTDQPAWTVAKLAVMTFEQLQGSAPDRPSNPIQADGTQYALRVIDRDSALEPSLPLSMQTEGLWEIRELPIQAQGDFTTRLPVCAFELVDIARPSILV
jgi:hypothetical protein